VRSILNRARSRATLLIVALLLPVPAIAQRHMEHLERGLIALGRDDGSIFVSWRWLGTEPNDAGFNLYRTVDGAGPAKLNAQPLRATTCFIDDTAPANASLSYFVRALAGDREQSSSPPFQLTQAARTTPYLTVPLRLPSGYSANDGAVGDLDGDGEYDLVLKSEQRPRDTASTGLTGETILQGYRLDGSLLWTIRLGRNIREGAHYTQFMVYDLDSDGIAEVACKTADGSVDGEGKVLGDPGADWRDTNQSSRTFGRVLKGPEYFTIFSGRTGAALATTNYIPARGDISGWGGIGGNGGNDSVGNRVDRFLACVAYLDGERPSVVMCRGYYGRSVLAAWDWRDGRLTSRWVFDSKDKDSPYSGQGGHQLSVADVDGDGRDEIVYHAMVVDDNGAGLYSTGLRHGDALHVGDLDPAHPGLEVFGIHENEDATAALGTPGTAVFAAKDGRVLWSHGPGADVGRGLTADIDPRHPGEEMWSGPAGLRTCKGERLGAAPRSANFAVWWDDDLLREVLDRNQISKWDWTTERLTNVLTAIGATWNNGSKATPVLAADILGDWREEVIWRTPDSTALRIYSSTITTTNRLRTLMHDPQYRLSVAWQNVGYNQPPHPGFFLGHGMKLPAPPRIVSVKRAPGNSPPLRR
jgi:rhamnogalacturonan endolyase